MNSDQAIEPKTETSTNKKQMCVLAQCSFTCMIVWVSFFIIECVLLLNFNVSKRTADLFAFIIMPSQIASPILALASILRIFFSKKPLRGYLFSLISLLVFSLFVLLLFLYRSQSIY